MKGKSGFTLIEILIAIAILSFISLGVFQIVDNALETQSSVTKEDKEFIAIQAGLRKLESDFEKLYTPLFFDFPSTNTASNLETSYQEEIKNPYNNHDNFDGVSDAGIPIPAIFFEKNKEIIMFTRTNSRKFKGAKQSSFNWVRYRVDTSSEGQGLNRLTRQTVQEGIYNREIRWSDTPIYTVIDNIKKVEFFLWDPDKKEWKDNIPENGKYYGPLLKINLIWVDSNENEITEQKVFRIFWPSFDTVKDEEIRRNALSGKKTTKTGSLNQSEGFND